jgi:pimeloyl-ACP methyl ester carboxylesterase
MMLGPDINRRTDTYRVMTWDHRGLGGSERPSDESRISISDHTDDLFAVMDSYGVDRAVVIGWSAGVNVAFEAAVRQPPRIAGVLAVGGVPVLRVSQDDDDGVIRVDDDPIRRTAPLGVLSGAVVGVVTALPSG